MRYQIIDKCRAQDIAKLAVCLTTEIIERTGVNHFDIDIHLAIKLCENYIANELYHVMAAFDGDHIVGFASICESHSLYAEGSFGIIQEFYVLPEYRSHKIGESLIEEVTKLAKKKQWKRLELCTPPVPEFDRTLDFYKSNGFEITGGYKMKLMITE